MYWFFAGLLAGVVLNFLSRKLSESDSFNLILEALKPAKLPFSKARPRRTPGTPVEQAGKEVKAVGMQ